MQLSVLLAASALYLMYLTCSVNTAPCLIEGNADVYRVKPCPEDWVRYGSSKCFKYFPIDLDYGSALEACESLGSTLACLASYEEHEFLKSYILSQYETSEELPNVWLGGEARASRWFWTDFSPFEYTNWHSGYGLTWSDGQSIALATHSENVNDTSGPNPDYGKMLSDATELTFEYICQKFQIDGRAVAKIKA